MARDPLILLKKWRWISFLVSWEALLPSVYGLCFLSWEFIFARSFKTQLVDIKEHTKFQDLPNSEGFFFCKKTQNSKWKKTNLWFFWNFHLPYSPQKFELFKKMQLLILLYQSHLHQIFITLTLPWIHQPPWTTNLKLLMHRKIDFFSSYLISYALKQHLFHFLSIFIKKIPRLTSGSLQCWTSVCLEKLSKSSHWLKVWNQFFFQICGPRWLPYKSFGHWRLLQKSSDQCRG